MPVGSTDSLNTKPQPSMDSDYNAKNDLDRLFEKLKETLGKEKPEQPLDAIIAAVNRLKEVRERGESIADYSNLFEDAVRPLCLQAATPELMEMKHFSWDADHIADELERQKVLDEAVENPGWSDEAMEKAARALSGGPAKTLPGFNPGRRYSISAEPYTPSENKSFHRVVVAKDESTKGRINNAISGNLLFRNLDAEQTRQIVDAMFEKRVPANVSIIRQGDEGDYFYVIDSGRFHVIKDGVFVVELGPGETFGELALMYGSPRMATVKAIEDSVLWAVDRQTFRAIVIDLAFRKRKMYEGFLRSVPLLKTLNDQEIYRICDALQSVTYKSGDVIVRQGDVGHEFYIVEEGEAKVTMTGKAEAEAEGEVSVATITKGGYFGELALLKDAPRAATVTAITPTVKCLTLNKADFIRLLGPLVPIMQRNQEHYHKYEEYLPLVK